MAVPTVPATEHHPLPEIEAACFHVPNTREFVNKARAHGLMAQMRGFIMNMELVMQAIVGHSDEMVCLVCG